MIRWQDGSSHPRAKRETLPELPGNYLEQFVGCFCLAELA